MDEQQQMQAVYKRASAILGLVPQVGPLNEVTATALVMAAALMVREGSKAPPSREAWLASCASVFDAAGEVLK